MNAASCLSATDSPMIDTAQIATPKYSYQRNPSRVSFAAKRKGAERITHSSACASYGAVTIVDTATGHTASVKLPATDARHAHVQGVSWAPQPAGRLAIAYSEFQCTPDKAGDLGPTQIYLVDVADPNTLRVEAPGAWPAWNRGREGLGAAPLPGGVFGALLRGLSP